MELDPVFKKLGSKTLEFEKKISQNLGSKILKFEELGLNLDVENLHKKV
jgi:hypothetical protein